ncbi:MAG TPA: peptidylprolyl isomerase [Geobacteraceae bacterium]
MAQAQKNDRVRINFTGTLADGTVFDSTLEREECDDACHDEDCHDPGCGCEPGPVDLTIGAGELFPQLEEALIGMAAGETKKITIAAEDAFGEYDEERVFTVPRADLPDDLDPAVGDELVLSGDDDEEIGVVVVEATPESITFDANHPLAGEDLTYEVELLAIL